MREQICIALAKHADQVLTKDVARAILDDIFPDLSYAPEQFGRLDYAGYSIQVERFKDVLPELEHLHAAQWEETEKARIGVAMNPDYAYMAEQERAGRMLQFTARDSATNELVGNMRFYRYLDTHAKQLCAKEDTFYVKPAHRGGFLAVRISEFAERSLVSTGVREIVFTSKLANKAHRMALFMKYTPIGIEFVKRFDASGKFIEPPGGRAKGVSIQF